MLTYSKFRNLWCCHSNDISFPVQQLFLISVRAGANLIFGGSAEPAAFVKVVSIGKLGEEENKRHSKVFSQLLEDHLKVSPKR